MTGKTLVERLRAQCTGHPNAKIPWPHRLLHDAADRIEALEARVRELEKAEHRVDTTEGDEIVERMAEALAMSASVLTELGAHHTAVDHAKHALSDYRQKIRGAG